MLFFYRLLHFKTFHLLTERCPALVPRIFKIFLPQTLRDAAGLMNLHVSDGGKYDGVAPILLAHELGHVMGAAKHDEERGEAENCRGKYIMTPSVGYDHTTWSYCSR